MDKANVESMRAYLETMLTGFEEHFGVQVNVGRITYSPNNCKIPLQVSDVTEDGFVASKEAMDFKNLACTYGLEADMLGKQFELRGTKYELTGLNTRAHKFPFSCRRVKDGKGFKMNVDSVKKGFGILSGGII